MKAFPQEEWQTNNGTYTGHNEALPSHVGSSKSNGKCTVTMWKCVT